MKFVKNPNLPEEAAAVIIAKNTPQDVINELKKLNTEVIFSTGIGFKTKGVSYHSDMQITHIRENKIIVHHAAKSHYEKYFNCTSGASMKTGTYPEDVAYNVAIVGKYMICNEKYADKKVLEAFPGEIINVRQGYAKCSTLIVDENSIITADDGIFKAALRHNMNVLKIGEGGISLPGQNYGFIGGASGKLAKNMLAFSGDIKTHPDYENIRSFCLNSGVYTYSLGKGKLTDIGGILPIKEK